MSLQNAKWLNLVFPFKGVHEESAISEQPEGTTPLAENVRGYDLEAQRDRGCQRPGLLLLSADKETGEAIDAMQVGDLANGWSPGILANGTDGTYSLDLTGGTIS